MQATLEAKRANRLQKEAELAAELKRIRTKNQFLEADKAKKEAARALKPTFLNTVIHDHDGRADSPTSVDALPPTDEEREPNSN